MLPNGNSVVKWERMKSTSVRIRFPVDNRFPIGNNCDMGDPKACAPEQLRSRLRVLGWTQLELASAVGASPANVSRWLSGERTPSLDMAFAIERSEVALPASIWVDVDVVSDPTS